MGDVLHLSGNQAQVVDAKNRLVIPAKFREALGPSVKLGLLPHSNFFVLTVCSAQVFQTRMQTLSARAEHDPALADTVTLLEGMTEECDLDDQGRITVTADLKGYSGIERDVVVIGHGDHLQIWPQGRWDDFRRKALETPAALRDALFRRNPS